MIREYKQIAISEIKFDESERQRKGIGTVDGKDPKEDSKKVKMEFENLKASIKTYGLMQPIGVSITNELRYGRRRLAACTELGWTHVPVLVEGEEIPELDQQIMELDENIQRLELSWHERVEAIAKINKLRQQQDPSWNQKRTAAQLGITQPEVSKASNVADMLELFPEFKKAKSLNAAVSQMVSKGKALLRQQEVKSNPDKYKEVSQRVVCGKSEEIILKIPDGFAKHIITDGPFGINYDNQKPASGAHEAYEDSPESYRKRTNILAHHMYRIIDTDGFLVWFLGHDHLDWTRELFRSVGFKVDPVPLVWDRSDGRCHTNRPDRWFGKGYDIALHCVKGEPQMINRSRNRGKNGSGNVFRYKGVDPKDKEHIVERPIELYEDIISCMTLEGEMVVDLFAGSGKISAACAKLKRQHFAIEMNPNHVALAIQNIYNNTPQ